MVYRFVTDTTIEERQILAYDLPKHADPSTQILASDPTKHAVLLATRVWITISIMYQHYVSALCNHPV